MRMTNWYTADPHFMHENVISFCDRPFRSVHEMDSVLLENMHAVVKPEDELWIVGDFAFGPKAKDETKLTKIFEKLPGAKKHLVVGNHDQAPTLALPWDSVHHLSEVRDGPHRQAHTLCHYLMITWNHARRRALHMFGHVHNNWLGPAMPSMSALMSGISCRFRLSRLPHAPPNCRQTNTLSMSNRGLRRDDKRKDVSALRLSCPEEAVGTHIARHLARY